MKPYDLPVDVDELWKIRFANAVLCGNENHLLSYCIIASLLMVSRAIARGITVTYYGIHWHTHSLHIMLHHTPHHHAHSMHTQHSPVLTVVVSYNLYYVKHPSEHITQSKTKSTSASPFILHGALPLIMSKANKTSALVNCCYNRNNPNMMQL